MGGRGTVTVLVICPDYASHLLPLVTIATAWRDAGERVVVATGPATAAIVESFGFDHVELSLGRGSNPGVIRADEQPRGEDDALRGFFDATRRGMIDTLAYQAGERLNDFMWEPVRIGRAVQAVVDSVRPREILVDHLAFSARLALTAAGVPYADVVVGHPSALPVGDEVYGFPPAWPEAFEPSSRELAELRELCVTVSDSFTVDWNAALAELNPSAAPSTDAFEEHGELVLFNYPARLADPGRQLPPQVFIGSAVRDEPRDAVVGEWIATAEPFVYVSFGSFLSVRSDVLARVCAAIASIGIRAAVALGSAERDDLGALPEGWLVREFLPQVTLLRSAAAAVTHGGNNSVTEAMTCATPLVVLPFSTDQFAGAAALERAGFGVALPPNEATVEQLAAALREVLALPLPARAALDELAGQLHQEPGSARAFAAVVSSTSLRIASASPAAPR